MAGNFEIEVPIKITDSGGSKAGEKLAKDFASNIKDSIGGFGFGGDKKTDSMGSGIVKIAASVGVIAAIWQGIAPLMRPVLKMLGILLTLLLLPLMPLIKQMVQRLAKTAKNVSAAQKAAGGSGFDAFIAGIGELMKSPTIWALAGVGLAASFAASLGAVGIAGVLAGLISLDLLWGSITSGEETTLSEKLKTAGWAGLSAGIAALLFGAGSYALAIGALVMTLSLGLSFIADALKEEDFKSALLDAAGGSALMGIVAGAVVALLGLGLGTAGVVAVAVGTIVFTAIAGFKLFKDWKGETESLNEEVEKQKGALETADKAWNIFGGGVLTFLKNDLIPGILTMGQMIGSPTKGSYPIVYALKLAEAEWITMRDVSVVAINDVITNLNRIPRTITTTHYIRTVKL